MIKDVICKMRKCQDIGKEEMTECMTKIMSGTVDPIEICAFLTALSMKGESVEEITAAAKVLREKATPIDLGGLSAMDTCGTGGDGGRTYNVSTAVAFVVAAAGIPVVKHGNRSVSSQCGSADVLEALGGHIDLTPAQAKAMLQDTGLCFIYAPSYHGAMKHVAHVRRTLGFRTLFNILGPLVNPARVSGQVIGVYDDKLTEKMAFALRSLGTKRALVVHGKDGMDELTVTDESIVTELDGEAIRTYVVSPEQYGLGRHKLESLQGGDAKQNSGIIQDVLGGMRGPTRDLLLINAGAAIYIGGIAKSIEEGIRLAENIVDQGKALRLLVDFITYSNQLAQECVRLGLEYS